MSGAVVDSVLNPAGPVAGTISEIAWVLIIGSTVVFCLVIGLLAWALLRRTSAAAEASAAAERRATNWWVLGAGFALPVLVLGALLVYTVQRTTGLTPPRDPAEPIISVTAHLWWWEVRYRDPASGRDIVLANEIRLPTGRAVTLGLTSADVIHSFWVPALAGKVDMLPGRTHQLRLQADRPGTYRGQCAEFCGTQHARMALHVVAEPAPQFDRWLAAQARPATLPLEPQALRGVQVFAEQRCSACHNVRGIAPGASIGPDLTHVGSRLHLGAGTLPNGRDGLHDWLVHTQAVKPGVRMPSYDRLEPAALADLIAFLEHLQ